MSKQDVMDATRFGLMDRKGRSFYVTVGEDEIIGSTPSDARDSNDLLATLTALTRMASIALQNGVEIDTVKKQLRESSINKNDLPDLILQAMEKYEERKWHQEMKSTQTSL